MKLSTEDITRMIIQYFSSIKEENVALNLQEKFNVYPDSKTFLQYEILFNENKWDEALVLCEKLIQSSSKFASVEKAIQLTLQVKFYFYLSARENLECLNILKVFSLLKESSKDLFIRTMAFDLVLRRNHDSFQTLKNENFAKTRGNFGVFI